MPEFSKTSAIRDNHHRGSVGEFLREQLRAGADLDIVTAYFTVFAYDKLRAQLDNLGKIRLLFGEAAFVKNLDPEHKDGAACVLRDDGLALVSCLNQRHIAQSCADWIRDKVEVRSVTRTGFLHGKMSHIRRGEVSAAIVGSSNFTTRGLGLGATNNNVELNLIVSDDRDRDDLRRWFEELWNDTSRVEDVKQAVLDYLLQVYRDQSPEFIYFKTLFHLFEKNLNETAETNFQIGKTTLLESGIWNALFEFQKDGAKGAINKILGHNGCILADSVGLGKTYTALAVIKYFELRNQNVLVLCPKKLYENWAVYRQNSKLNPFLGDRFRFDILAHTDLSREHGVTGSGLNLSTLNWGNYDLVVIDESHNFRNNAGGHRDEEGNIIRKSRYQRLMEDILKAGVKSKVLLLSATPVNNELKDLRNQIYLLSEGNDAAFAQTLGIQNIAQTLKVAQQQFTRWANRKDGLRKVGDLLSTLDSGFFKLLDTLSIARSRKHIQNYYAGAIAKIGGFPIREKPESVHSEIDKKRRFMSYEKLDDEISKYTLSLYNPFRFVRPEFRANYEKQTVSGAFNQAGRERFLIGMMKVGFLKRLESSVHSFAATMERTNDKIDALETTIKKFKDCQKRPNALPGELGIEVDDELPLQYAEEDEFPSDEIGGRLKYKLEHLNLDAWLKALAQDKQQLFALSTQARGVSAEDDEKLAKLKEIIREKLTHPTRNKQGKENRKTLVFTAYSDTASYLHRNLADWARKEHNAHIALVTGAGKNETTLGGKEFNEILTNFSPRSKQRDKLPEFPQEEEIEILIATDCISEGQNLQDCDLLVNYDIHWNPVRIVQRFGRIDRIGSQNKSVKLVNFWPTQNLDHYIKLKTRVEARMALVDISATSDDNPLSNEELKNPIEADLRFRDKQLLRLKEEILDLDDLNEDATTLADFSLEDFRSELFRYLERNREQLEQSPLGLYAVVPTNSAIPLTIGGGAIFCLRQKSDTPARPATETEKINPLAPHYLVYVRNDGEVRLAYIQIKTILHLFRELALGKTEPHAELCRLFDRATQNGTDMAHQSRLIAAAIQSITATFQQKLASGLQRSRQFILPHAAAQPRADETEFTLVTWLVLQESPPKSP